MQPILFLLLPPCLQDLNPDIQSAICKVLESDLDVYNLNSVPQQFNSPIINLVKCVLDKARFMSS